MSMITHRVVLTEPYRALLREGYERLARGKKKDDTRRIAAKALIPRALVGSVCQVRGFEPSPTWMELEQFHRLIEVLYG